MRAARDRVVIIFATNASRSHIGRRDASDCHLTQSRCESRLHFPRLDLGVHGYRHNASSQVRSGLGTVKRDWSANKSQDTESGGPDPGLRSGWSLLTPPKKSSSPSSKSRLDDLQASLSDRITSSEELLFSSRTSQKRVAEPSDFLSRPPAKKRVLPASFTAGPQPATKSISRTGSKSWGSFTSSKQNASSSSKRTPSHTTTGISKSSASISLSQEQNHILKLAQEGKSLFYTGSAGTGKSVLLREIIKTLRKKYVSIPDAVAVTASTGMLCFLVLDVTLIPLRYRCVQYWWRHHSFLFWYWSGTRKSGATR